MLQSNSRLQQRNDKVYNLCSFLSLQSFLVTHSFFPFVFQSIVKLSEAYFHKFGSVLEENVFAEVAINKCFHCYIS